MKLYMVLYILGKVAGVWGPLHYDETECKARIEDMIKSAHDSEQAKTSDGKPLHLKDVRFACETKQDRPSLDPLYAIPK